MHSAVKNRAIKDIKSTFDSNVYPMFEIVS